MTWKTPTSTETQVVSMSIDNPTNVHRGRLLGMSKRSAGIAGLCIAAVAVAVVLGLVIWGGSSPTPSATSLVNAGIAAQNAGNNATASKDYVAALSIEPKNVFALFDLGDVQQYMGNVSAAQSNYFHALAINPNFEAALYNLATLVRPSTRRRPRALYGQVIRLSPKDADAHFNLGFILLGLHKTQRASAARDAVRLDPTLKSRIPKG